jgi:hypothetical protein
MAVSVVSAVAVVGRSDTNTSAAIFFEPAEVVSTAPGDGGPWGRESSASSISADGSVVEFGTRFSDEFNPDQVSVRVRLDDDTFTVPEGLSENGTVSDDGCVIAYWVAASSLIGNTWDLVAFDRCAGESTVVDESFGSLGAPPAPAVTADGSRIAVVVDNWIAVYDLEAGTYAPTMGFNPFSVDGDDGSDVFGPLSISDDGSILAFAARRYEVDQFTAINVWTTDLESSGGPDGLEFELVSSEGDGEEPEIDSLWPSISGDGNVVAFTTCDYDVTGGSDERVISVDVVDRIAGERRRIAGPADSPAISQDGRHVAFVALVEDFNCSEGEYRFDELPAGDVFVATSTAFAPASAFDAFETDLVSYTTAGVDVGVNDASLPAISGRGRWVAFDSLLGIDLVDDERFNDRYNVYVRERPPDLEVSAIAFGEVTVGTSLDRVSTVTNVGLSAWVITSAQLTSGFSLVGSTCGLVIDPGVTCELTIRFAPAADDDVFGTLTVRDESYPARVLTEISRLTGRGVTPTTTTVPIPPVYSLIAEPAIVDFAPLTLGTSSVTQTVTVRNNGNITNILSGIGIGGADSGDFAIVATNCGGAALVVGGACNAQVRFTPAALGGRTATLVAQGSGGSSASSALRGEGTPVPVFALAIEPPNFGFPFTAVGDTSPARTAVVRNTGNVPNQISSVSTTGSLAADYSVVSSTCIGVTLPVGGTCIIDVVFRPSDSGPRLATLLAAGQGGSSATAVLLGPSLYEPTLEPVPTVATIGQVVTVFGSGFPPLSTVELEWAVTDDVFSVQTDATGSFLVPMMVVVRNGFGEREIVARAQPDRFDEVTTEFLLVLNTMQPRAAVMTIQAANNLLSR